MRCYAVLSASSHNARLNPMDEQHCESDGRAGSAGRYDVSEGRIRIGSECDGSTGATPRIAYVCDIRTSG
jgi:hypothetical protein